MADSALYEETPRPPEFSDDALANKFAEQHVRELKYVAAWGWWMQWAGHKWATDDVLNVFDRARQVCRAEAARANKPKLRAMLASAKTVAAVERLARSDPRLAARVQDWDSDDWLLNTPTGAVDLKNGTEMPNEPWQSATKATAVGLSFERPAAWIAFLNRVTNGNGELMGFLQRVCGYCLTGSTRDHALFFLYGTGANGKSVFLNTVSAIVGDYSTTASMETFIASSSDRHPTDLASLRGARLVTASETEQGRHWTEARIKALTGGDKIAARHMRQDFFEFVPKFKLLVAGNHKPSLRNVDEAMRRRLHLIPFTVTIPPAERDPGLAEKLKEEWPAILNWMIEGAQHWQTSGLNPPSIVKEATAEYMDAEDAIAAWMAECIDQAGSYTVHSSELFQSWREWAERAREFSGTQKAFTQTLLNRGFQKKRERGGVKFMGLKVRSKHDYSDAHWNR
jgi:putative DNA primase/helicase